MVSRNAQSAVSVYSVCIYISKKSRWEDFRRGVNNDPWSLRDKVVMHKVDKTSACLAPELSWMQNIVNSLFRTYPEIIWKSGKLGTAFHYLASYLQHWDLMETSRYPLDGGISVSMVIPQHVQFLSKWSRNRRFQHWKGLTFSITIVHQ